MLYHVLYHGRSHKVRRPAGSGRERDGEGGSNEKGSEGQEGSGMGGWIERGASAIKRGKREKVKE